MSDELEQVLAKMAAAATEKNVLQVQAEEWLAARAQNPLARLAAEELAAREGDNELQRQAKRRRFEEV